MVMDGQSFNELLDFQIVTKLYMYVGMMGYYEILNTEASLHIYIRDIIAWNRIIGLIKFR